MHFFVLCIFIFYSTALFAQTETSKADKPKYKSLFEFSTSTGPSLPYRISALPEIVPTTFFNLYTSWTYFPIEIGYLFGQSEGYRIARQFISVTNGFNIFDMNYFWTFGISSMEYENIVDAPFSNIGPIRTGGWHYGVGIKYQVGKSLFIRPELNLAIRPSKLLFVGIGIGFSLPEASTDKN